MSNIFNNFIKEDEQWVCIRDHKVSMEGSFEVGRLYDVKCSMTYPKELHVFFKNSSGTFMFDDEKEVFAVLLPLQAFSEKEQFSIVMSGSIENIDWQPIHDSLADIYHDSQMCNA